MNNKIPPPVVGLTVVLLMWGTSSALAEINFNATWQLPVAILVGLLGFAVSIAGLLAFRRVQTTVNPMNPEEASSLVDFGIFRYSRNPMYLGLLLVLAGFAIWFGNPLNFFWLVFFVLFISRFQIAPEERVLQEKFPEAFADYCARVRRWI
ncbi:methyltransferase family protein [Biformimicrobium ophioploci]|uniref:Isoprenylcysteine carboxylmethyltransferase family protein n=1 Tax=Biformimicrobium ophioploci TaxID=3036711 RepID=A0ABQ6M117_9GAMM|nr:isoprenylcysteine carboxylmethyltransferase family protein [Microbulbifer sp. NKW57]GMG87991.1 isoprenylcysteine carboxylmethyltransferase family protein [Microbulbifer sp. NKW57]